MHREYLLEVNQSNNQSFTIPEHDFREHGDEHGDRFGPNSPRLRLHLSWLGLEHGGRVRLQCRREIAHVCLQLTANCLSPIWGLSNGKSIGGTESTDERTRWETISPFIYILGTKLKRTWIRIVSLPVIICWFHSNFLSTNESTDFKRRILC